MNTRIRTLNFLPEIFQTNNNAQFLAATLDQLVAQPNTKKMQGYIGSKFGYGINAKDFYVTEPTKIRKDYQLDPGVIFTKKNESVAQDFISYPGILDALKLEGGIVNNNNRLFESEIYSWDSFTNLDKIINFNQYYWLPEGPDSVTVTNDVVFSVNDYLVKDFPNGYNIIPLASAETAGSTNPTLTLLRGGTYTFSVDQNSQFWIQGEPGITGFSQTQPNLQTREVLGVNNNGASSGVVTFVVPPANAQDQYNLPGNNLVDVVSTLPFSEINGKPVSILGNIDGVTSLENLRLMFYNTGVVDEIGYVSNFFDFTPFDANNNLTPSATISITDTTAGTNAITCNSTAGLVVGGAITFTGIPFGGLSQYSTTLPNTIYFIESILNSTQFTVSLVLGGPQVILSTATGSLTGNVSQGFYEQGYYTTVNDNFYTITYVGDPSDPIIRLIPYAEIPVNENITSVFGTQYISRSFYKSDSGGIILIPYISAPLNTLYYQDGTISNKVGVIKIIDSNATNTLDVEKDILGKITFTASNGIIFTNGLKVKFQGDITPVKYLENEYYVEGVGTSIELLPVTDFIVPENFSASIFEPWDIVPWDITGWEGSNYVPVTPDYVTISRNSIDKNGWSRSNRWFHIDVINATAQYNNNPNLISEYTNINNKAKRPIIEFYPNIKLFNSGSEGKLPVDFVDVRTSDAFSLVAGQRNYYPDVEVYTKYSATIAATNYTSSRILSSFAVSTNIFTCNSTTGFRVNDAIVFIDTPPGLGISTGIVYYIKEIVSTTEFKISSVKNGAEVGFSTNLPSGLYTGPWSFNWTPQSTTITINAADVVGSMTVGQYITDSTNQLPKNAQIASITGTTILTIDVEWSLGSIGFITGSANASLVATDTTTDNYALFDGSTVIFANDDNENVRNKIYVARFSTITESSVPVITLTEIQFGDVLENQQTVAKRGYFNGGKQFWFDGSNWKLGQQKTNVNQPPLFDVFDKNGVSFGNSEIYTGTSFTGCKLFAYGIGSGSDDLVLGFPIRYSSIDNLGDISFDISLNTDTFDYVSGTSPITQQVNTGYVFKYSNRVDFDRQLGWQTAISPSIQYQLFEFTYDPLAPQTMFVCDVQKIDNSQTNWPTVEVYVNNILLSSTQYSIGVGENSTTITLIDEPLNETIIQILVLSNQVSNVAYYTIPINLNNNPFNTDLTIVNIGDIRGQYQSMFFNNPNSSGTVFGSNNYRDLGNMVPYGNKIIQNSGSLVLPGALLRKQDHNIFNALMFNSKEYVKFKNLLAYTVENAEYTQRFDPSTLLDDVLEQIAASKTDNQPFFWSDMLPNKAAYITNTYSFANSLDSSVYPLSKVYDFTKANYNGVLVYVNRNVSGITVTKQLIKDVDYTISLDSPSLTVTFDLLPNDIVTIKEYNQTYGSYVPNTPTKLGLYPAFIPKVLLDANYKDPTYFIKGHDGSYTKLYGEYNPTTQVLTDFRDQVLLEFEIRIYNNLKLASDIPVPLAEIIPGFFRENDYTYDEWLQMYSVNFLNWIGQNRLDYKTQLYNSNDVYSYNYSQSGNSLNNQPIIQGYWRGIYQYFYDTSNPDTMPWEMLGIVNKPSWWDDRYGPAPYTSDNLILWEDLSQGINWNNGDPIVIEKAIRPGLLEILPVDSAGNLVQPLACIVGNYNQKLFKRDWKIGDNSPVELSYRRSSTYPFDLIKLMALMKPAKFFNLAVDIDNYKFNTEFNQYLVNDRTHLIIKDIEVYGNGVAKTSYLNWIIDYEKQVGIPATTNMLDLLDNLDVRLVYRLAGFSDKALLKFLIEKRTPNSTSSSLLIPDESYSILLYDNQPFDRIKYSGVIVQITNGGYLVYGNSQTTAYFTTLKPKFAGNWQNFNIEDVTVRITSDHYENSTQLVPYGTKFYSVQEVAQFLSDYGAYLSMAGMQFEEQENELTLDWNQMISEFIYWSQTGWEIGSVVTLNPAASKLVIDKDSNIVQPLTLQQSNFVLNQNLYPIPISDLSITRDGTRFDVTALNAGDVLSYGQFNLSNFEHGIVFDNTTLFNDVIYNLVTGLRQLRIILRGTKSAEWNGTVDAAGFIYNQQNINEWNKQTKYTKGEIVTYKNKYWIATKIIQASETFKEEDWKRTDYDEVQRGLLPNPSTRSYESTLYYDTNQSNLELDADQLSFSLIGYRSRNYLDFADLTDVTQINVYKNFIKNKGTKNSTDAFKGATLLQGGIKYDIYENWAIKSGEFGGVLNSNFVEFKLNQQYLTGNPSIVGLNDGIYTKGVQQEIPLYSIFNYERPITSVDILPTTHSTVDSSIYPSAGYVNYNDVKLAAFFYSQLPLGINKNDVVVPIQDFYVRDYAWVANYKERWEVFTPVSIGQVINARNNLNETVTLTFNDPHNLTQFQPFAVVNFDDNIDGYYLVTIVVDPYRVLVNKIIDPTIKNITGQGIALKLISHRVSSPADIASLPLLNNEFTKNKVWVDTDASGSWGVYRKNINYSFFSQVTKPSSQSLGSAVAINDALGYLIGDADDGKVHRYVYNALLDSDDLVQTLTGNVGFGTTIDYSGDLYAISEPTGPSRKVNLYQLQNTTESTDLVLYQSIAAPGVSVTNWGSAVSISGDQNWMYISDINNNSVYVYQKNYIPTPAGSFTVGQTYTISEIGNTDFTLAGATTNVVGISFVATSAGTGTGVAVNSTYRQVSIIDGDALSLTTPGDNFGKSISTNYNGEYIVIGVPNRDANTVTDNGCAFYFNRLKQSIEIQNNIVPASMQLAWTPANVQKSVISTTAPNTITLNNTTNLSINDPIIFTTTAAGLSGTNIVSNIVYYINSIAGSNITIKQSRFATSLYPVTTNASVTGTLTAQTTSLNVYKNGKIVTDNNYAAVGDKLVYSGLLDSGDILTVSGNEIIYAQSLTSGQPTQIGTQFGSSVDTNTHASEILVGAPFELNSQFQEGAVYRYTNAGAKYGSIIGTGTCNVTSSRKILINGYLIFVTPGNADHVANIIRSANVTNVTASASDGKLVISLLNTNLAPANEKLLISVDNITTLTELGISVLTNTQTILCPHTNGPTQFGTVVKFNEFDSFVASAPVGTRYSATTYDFVDDENQSNDTIFDNNATQWVDESLNFGAVYMFDYVSQYNENILDTGKFVYSQSVNSLNLVYTPFNTFDQTTDITQNNQPRYGTALDFNNYYVAIGTPRDTGFTTGSTYSGSATIYNNTVKSKNWSLLRSTSPVVDVNKLSNIQIFDFNTNQTLINMDYIDPLNGKILGAARDNIDIIANVDPATYNNLETAPNGLVWGEPHIGKIWLNTSNLRYVNYHQNNDVEYNSQYWGTLFPGSDVAVYTWIASNVIPEQYQGPGTPFQIESYSIRYTINPSGALSPIYYYWVRDTNTVYVNNGKTLSDSVIASYIENPKNSGISYFAPLLSNVYGLYNSNEYINSTSSVLHIGYATGNNDDPAHRQFNLIRDGNADDFLPGVPLTTDQVPDSLYDRLLDSLCGVDETGATVPNPYLPISVRTGVLTRPRQSFFFNRYEALKNYLQYANSVLLQYPISEIRQATLLNTMGTFYQTSDYWEYVNWWAEGYDNNTKSTARVSIYAELSTLTVPIGTIVTVLTNLEGKSETYIFEGNNAWKRIGLENGTISFKSTLWDYFSARIGYGDSFFDTNLYDQYPSEETRKILRALNEQIYTEELLIHRNKSLILLFEYIQSETSENQNYLPWLNKTSFIDVSHTIRDLKPIEVYQGDNQEFLLGYINEVKPYHVVIKEFLFKYTGEELYEGNITDFDLPSAYDKTVERYVTPQLVYANPNKELNEFLPTDPIWQNPKYAQWFENQGIAITGEPDVEITALASFISLNSLTFTVDNAQGLPINGILTIDNEDIGYSSVDRSTNTITGLTRGLNGTDIATHLPGTAIFIDLPPVLLLNGARGYTEPPKVTAFIDTTLYPPPKRPAVLQAVMSLDSILRIDTIDPGQGYAVSPTIVIDPAITINFSSADVSPSNNVVNIPSSTLVTGDLIQYKVGPNSSPIGGLENGQWYYINVSENLSFATIRLYNNYTDSLVDRQRIVLFNSGTGQNHSFNLGGRASSITTAYPIRENDLTIRFDRTTYSSQVIDWVPALFYGSYYAGDYFNSESVASSSIMLQSISPPIDSIIISAQGVVFEITDVRNEREINYSSFIRQVVSTQSSNDVVRLILQDDGSGNPNASGGTLGFYVGMPVKFVGDVGSSGLANETMYYVNSIVNQTDFTISNDPSGSPMLSLNDYTIGLAGLECYTGEVTDTAIISVNYPGIRNVVETSANSNKISVSVNPTGTGGTSGFYVNMPVFFTGTNYTLPNNGVFGNIIENQIYYINTITDEKTFTMSESKDPLTFEVVSTDATTDSIVINGDAYRLQINEPVIFTNMVIAGSNTNNFGNIISGNLYYVAGILNGNSFQISTSINGGVFALATVTSASNTSSMVTSQKTTVTLADAVGSYMQVNVNYPVSPGQIDGQRFDLYETSQQYPNLTGTNVTLLSRTIAALIGQRTIDATTVNVNRIVLINRIAEDSFPLGLDNIYINLPVEASTDLFDSTSYLTPGTTYYVVDKGFIEIEVTNTAQITTGTLVTAGNFVIGRTYIIDSLGSTDFTLIGASANTVGVNFIATGAGSGTGTAYEIRNELICDTTESLFIDMPIIFRGTGMGQVNIGVDYYVREIVDDHRFTISNTPGGEEVFVLPDSGNMIGNGLPYIQLSTSLSGAAIVPGDTQQAASISAASPAVVTVAEAPANGNIIIFRNGNVPTGLNLNVPYYVRNATSTTFNLSITPTGSLLNTSGSVGTTTMIIKTISTVDQTPLSLPVFDVSYILGGYSVIIAAGAGGTGYAVDNVLVIPGTNMGGTSPANDLTLTVKSITSTGAITGAICSGTVPGASNQYYLKVISPNELKVYQNQQLTVPLSGLSLPYVGVTETTVTNLTAGSNTITLTDASGFIINDKIVFTGDLSLSLGALVEGRFYYITNIAGNNITISENPGGTNVVISSTIAVNFVVAKSGSFAFLKEPFTFNESIVKYNNRVYVCTISNNDNEFVFGKWRLLSSGDRRLNAMDRVIGYYEPTVNMPGVDLSQLFDGITYPNSTYYGNKFQPNQQFELDTNIQNIPFYTTEIDINAIIWNGTSYLAATNAAEYSAIINSTTGATWDIHKLSGSSLNVKDILFNNGVYIIATENPATPLLSSVNGTVWSVLTIEPTRLQNLAFRNNVWVAVGEKIFSSTNINDWTSRYAFDNPLLTNMFYSVKEITMPQFNGFVAVGKGQRINYSSGLGVAQDINLIFTSTNGLNWNEVPFVSENGMFGIANNANNMVSVGERGIIYISNNGVDWLGVNEVKIISANSISNQLNVTSTAGFTVGDQVKFTKSFNVITAGVAYYVVNIASSTQIQVSLTSGGPPITLNSTNPVSDTYMHLEYSDRLNDVSYNNGTYITVGNNGTIKRSTNGYNWITIASGTSQHLNAIVYNSTGSNWLIVGDNNTILSSSDNGITWTSVSIFVQPETVYNVRGSEFPYGYGPEELVPGVITDNMTMIVSTKSGSNWDNTVYQHFGYNINSLELVPDSGTQTVYSFALNKLETVQTPTLIVVYLINGVTNLGTTLHEGIDYTIDWINFAVIMNAPLNFSPVKDKLRIDVYETGNSNQLVRENTKNNPIRMNSSTGWNEIYVDCNFSGLLSNGSGVIRPNTSIGPTVAVCTETSAADNTILCESVSDFILNAPFSIQGTTFGGIQEGIRYFVKTINYDTKRITISNTFNTTTGIAGPTLVLTNGIGSMTAIISVGTTAVWTDPAVYHNGNKLVLGMKKTVSNTVGAPLNTLTCNFTIGLAPGQRIVFSNTMFGNSIIPQQTYYIASIYDINRFRISNNSSATVAGSFIIGREYVITTIGTTDYTLIGAPSNTIGVSFVAAGTGTGNGTAWEILQLDTASGGAEFVTNDYALGRSDNGISASIIFSKGTYDSNVDYITYTLLGETENKQFGYTLPETQVFLGNGTSGPYNLVNFIGETNAVNAVVEINGLRVSPSDYIINTTTSSLGFTSIAPVSIDVVSVTTYNSTENQYFNTQYGITGNTVSNIVNISNTITSPLATVSCTNTTTGTNIITCNDTTGFVIGQPVIFKGTGFGNILTDGTVYYINSIASPTEFVIEDESGTIISLSTDSGLMNAIVGGLPTVRITTGSPHNLISPTNNNNLIKLDGILGAIQLNNNEYYAHVINSNQVDLYSAPYDSSVGGVNSPILNISGYTGGGYVFTADAFTIITTEVTSTSTGVTGNRLAVADTSILVEGTPVIFSGNSLGGVVLNNTYYIKDIVNSTLFTISETRGGNEFVLTNDSGPPNMQMTQWRHSDVDRLWVTVNGYRVPSSSLKLNENNQLTILTTIAPSDEVIITSMISTATPNEQVYLLNVDKENYGKVYRVNTQSRTWLTQRLENIDSVIHVDDVRKVTDSFVQEETVPSLIANVYTIGLNADKNSISNITVYNKTTSQFISDSNFELVISSIAPKLQINPGPYINVGDILVITILQGNLLYINGEQIRFSTVDFTNNTLSGLQRGANGTGEQKIVPQYAEVYGLLQNNQMSDIDYATVWNSDIYSPEGDPLQISVTNPAVFLKTNIAE